MGATGPSAERPRDGNNIHHNNNGILLGGQLVTSQAATVSNNFIHDNLSIGIDARTSSGIRFVGNVATNNHTFSRDSTAWTSARCRRPPGTLGSTTSEEARCHRTSAPRRRLDGPAVTVRVDNDRAQCPGAHSVADQRALPHRTARHEMSRSSTASLGLALVGHDSSSRIAVNFAASTSARRSSRRRSASCRSRSACVRARSCGDGSPRGEGFGAGSGSGSPSR
jgi:Right handed beta helix region